MDISDFIEKNILLIIFWTLFSKNCSFFGSLGEILFSAKLKQVIHKKVPKTYLELIFEHFLSTAFRDLMKNNFD